MTYKVKGQGQRSKSQGHVISLSRLVPMLYLEAVSLGLAGAYRVGRTRRPRFLFTWRSHRRGAYIQGITQRLHVVARIRKRHKKLSYRREAAQRSVSLKIFLSLKVA